MSSDAERRERRTKRRHDEASTSIQHRNPWPRDDKTTIDTFEEFADSKKAVNSKECINRVLKDEWDNYDSLFYNAWLGVSIEPTRLIDPYILWKLWIEPDIREMITQLEIGTMVTRAYDLHVDLVRQFMATVAITYSTSKARVAGDGTLTFFARGIRYMISITELCRIYGFQEDAAASRFPPFLGLDGFWKIIGTGAWNSNSATQTDIRHPTLRYFLRALANTLVCKM
ncbi:hypothetical protein F2Q69_00053860 [Brassica cretica]|uniref:Arabidopsis retrotransposon Orf1 C-terminal domain-containing protein n=1 Tax=Brassica cretica TaxID=69181 RepID=A0A8S9MT72_BRACR|nr:hypothetical protein F2Q69_00053860 [Brassica cretica]